MKRFLWISLTTIAVAVVVAQPAHLEIRVSPLVLLEGGSVRVQCRVPRRPENRWLTLGIANATQSTRQLDGESAPITFEQTYDHIDCESGEAYCVVTREGGKQETTTSHLTVTGCDQ